jgi:predicted ribosome quality control (RQC) complex YloA/Tae2 family protein
MGLRKHLKGARLVAVEQSQADRLLALRFQRGPEQPQLILELSGRHGNLFVLDSAGQVLSSLRPDRSPQRALRPGQAYVCPALPRFQPPPSELATLPADGSRSQALRARWEGFCQKQAETRCAEAIQQLVRQLEARLARELAFQEQQLAAAAEAPIWRQRGESLQGGWSRWQPGAGSLRVVNYHDPQLAEIEIPLDPALDLAGNINRCFARARRLERTGPQAEARLLQLWERQQVLQALASQPPGEALLTQLRSWLPRQQSAAEQGERQPWRTFFSARGIMIRVGKSARDNEALLRSARGHQVWLHLRNGTGAHVVIAASDPDSETLLDGAALALAYSSMPAEPLAEIVWTQVKYLRRLGASGQVAISRARTLRYRRTPERLSRLHLEAKSDSHPPEPRPKRHAFKAKDC